MTTETSRLAAVARPCAAMRGAVFLDRDGTVNRSDVRDGRPYAPIRLEDFEIFPAAVAMVERIRAEGCPVIIVTNQPDLATGKQTRAVLDAMHDQLRSELAVVDILICPHTDDAGCECRKPKPGMILEAARKWGVDLRRSVMVGDRWRDIEAGRAAGCATVFVDRGYTEETAGSPADISVQSLGDAVEFILARLQSPDDAIPERSHRRSGILDLENG